MRTLSVKESIKLPASPAFFTACIAAGLLCACLFPRTAFSADRRTEANRNTTPKNASSGRAGGSIQPVLRRWLEQRQAQSRHTPSADLTSEFPGLTLLSDGRLLCWVTLHPKDAMTSTGRDGEREIPMGLADLPGLDIDGRLGPSVQVRVPPDQIEALTRVPGVLHVGLPIVAEPLPYPLEVAAGDAPHESEGLTGMRVREFWQQGHRGQGVRIGILDVGFAEYEEVLGTELPATVQVRSFYNNSDGHGDLSGGGERHGTACAEVVHDVAPEADLYLANVATAVDLDRAVSWMVDQGVEVISHSLGWFLGGGDGTGPIHDIAARARREGIVFVTSSGNFARSHWTGLFQDADVDHIVEVDAEAGEEIGLPGIEAQTELRLVLLWDRWPVSTDLSFEIDLRSQDGILLATSETDYEGYPYAVRAVSYRAGSFQQGLRVLLRQTRGDGAGVNLRLFRVDGGGRPLGDHQIASGSLASPADSPDVLSVGAYSWDPDPDLERLEPFSSYGPTLTGVVKPEILGPDHIDNSVYSGFTGTSAACPHVAGTVGLLLSASVRGGFFDLRWSREGILRLLETAALPLTEDVATAAAGWGRVRLLLDQDPAASTPKLLALGSSTGRPVGFRLQGVVPSAPAPLRVFDLQGRLLLQLPAERIGIQEVEYRLDPPAGALRARGRYWALEPASGARAAFYWPGASGGRP